MIDLVIGLMIGGVMILYCSIVLTMVYYSQIRQALRKWDGWLSGMRGDQLKFHVDPEWHDTEEKHEWSYDSSYVDAMQRGLEELGKVENDD